MLHFILKHPLARKHKAKALRRIGQWQIKSRIFPSSRAVVPFIGSTKLYLSKNEHAALGNWYYGLSEFEMMSFLLHFLRPGDCFIDVGANIGSYSILASGVNQAYSIAIEPIPGTFEKLKQNRALNDLGNFVKQWNIGLSDQPGSLNFTGEKGQQNHVVREDEKSISNTTVKASTLDLIAEGYPPTLLKIDVEGFETAVLAGGHKTLQNPNLKAIIMETMGLGNRYGFDEAALNEKIQGFGFQPFEYYPFERKLLPGISGNGQTLYLRDVAGGRERVENARPFLVFGELI